MNSRYIPLLFVLGAACIGLAPILKEAATPLWTVGTVLLFCGAVLLLMRASKTKKTGNSRS